jgi:hypothetical protein
VLFGFAIGWVIYHTLRRRRGQVVSLPDISGFIGAIGGAIGDGFLMSPMMMHHGEAPTQDG